MNETTEKLYGYIRVSTKDQNEDRQKLAMETLIYALLGQFHVYHYT